MTVYDSDIDARTTPGHVYHRATQDGTPVVTPASDACVGFDNFQRFQTAAKALPARSAYKRGSK